MNKFKIAMKILCDMLVNFIQYMYSECSIELLYRWKLWRGNHLSLSLICSKFHWLFLPALPKKWPIILTLFSYHYQLFPYFSFALMFQVTMYWHLENQFCCRQDTINGQWKTSLPFLKLTHLSCHCLPLILISDSRGESRIFWGRG